MYATENTEKNFDIFDPVAISLRIEGIFNSITKQEDDMDFGLGILTFGTLGFVVAFGYISARATEKLRQQGGPKSSLSADGVAERLAARASK